MDPDEPTISRNDQEPPVDNNVEINEEPSTTNEPDNSIGIEEETVRNEDPGPSNRANRPGRNISVRRLNRLRRNLTLNRRIISRRRLPVPPESRSPRRQSTSNHGDARANGNGNRSWIVGRGVLRNQAESSNNRANNTRRQPLGSGNQRLDIASRLSRARRLIRLIGVDRNRRALSEPSNESTPPINRSDRSSGALSWNGRRPNRRNVVANRRSSRTPSRGLVPSSGLLIMALPGTINESSRSVRSTSRNSGRTRRALEGPELRTGRNGRAEMLVPIRNANDVHQLFSLFEIVDAIVETFERTYPEEGN